MTSQPWYTSPLGWLAGLGSNLPGYDTAIRLPIEPLFGALRATLIGRRIETTLGGSPLAVVVSDLEASFDPVSTAFGQIDDVLITSDDIEFDGLRARRVEVRPRNVHTRPGFSPTLVAAPLDVLIEADWNQVQALLRRHLGRVDVEPLGGQRARLRPTGHRSRHGWLDVDLQVVNGRVELHPAHAGWGESGLRRRLRAVPAIPIPTALGDAVRIVDLAVDRDAVTVALRVDQWSIGYGRLLSF
ncbi:hypothetical protein [Gordonia sp. PP30]|uniref:hypothetical protein n=1 Tax=unclassified Gordonia (in: high G+C Gram-positive bacteria) TaxID=2657482 RepID=UPI001FFEB26A|nr:hypothetical protein [Gordonia sp. PP30]UQE75478.1 hypothetical protein MYK68_02315 [Gordonia sp. PP30]